ncbi:MAG TPA: glycerol-3-phosphate dehydrogenase/oxidase [Planctomycetaceae bacterium]|nr:glycerol-3-phosphate dehydrogenase/oxidase [Planctomycetaceae bacterium]
MTDRDAQPHGPVLILGAGINGAALARELALNRVDVCVVDVGDVCSGTTPWSSRLIHGGLRYLEYGEFDLVRESLAERTRLLQLAPQFVQPLRLFIPVRSRLGGFVQSAVRFIGWGGGAASDRGLWLVQTGLQMYDSFATGSTLPGHQVHDVSDPDVPPVDSSRYSWLCSYWDAQIRAPERFVLALLEDARTIAAGQGTAFELFTYHEARFSGKNVEIRPHTGSTCQAASDAPVVRTFEPLAVINATGAWVDFTLQYLAVAAPRLMGGTKGSHLLTPHRGLREMLGGNGIYAEAPDGRPVFLLPFGDATLSGTTDIPFEGCPEDALADDSEIGYLLSVVREVMPQVGLTRSDIDLHYCGVRPLPFVGEKTPGSITRRHRIERHADAPVPMLSLVGGKLTTCRALAEETTRTLLEALGRRVVADSRSRIIPGGEGFTPTAAVLRERQAEWASRHGWELHIVEAIWQLTGSRAESILAQIPVNARTLIAGTSVPVGFVQWSIEHEWVRTLDDLVERRLLLLYAPALREQTLSELAELLVAAGKLRADAVAGAVEACRQRLANRFGKRLT